MKKIFFIARNELYSLFYSPIAWVLLILFLFLTSVEYIAITEVFLEVFKKGGWHLRLIENLTSNLASDRGHGFLYEVIKSLYMFVPLITMGLISKETSSGTIKLLYSSPLKIREIVLGKFLAMLCFTFCLILLLSVTLIALSMTITAPDYKHLLAAMFGLFLLLSAYAAIGLFISSLTSYQIVAAIVTFGFFALLSRVGRLWQDIDTVRSITSYMHMEIKLDSFVQGLMNLRDLSYFMIVIISFLAFTMIRIKSATESISRLKKASRYLAVIAGAFIIAYITRKPGVNLYFDATRNQVHTITPLTQNLLSKLDGELEITVFGNLFDQLYNFRNHPTNQNGIMTDVLEQYIRFKPDIRVNFLHYYNGDSTVQMVKRNPGKTLRKLAEERASSLKLPVSLFLGPEEVNKMVDTKAENYRSFFLLKYKGRTAIARTSIIGNFWPFEEEMAAALSRLVATPPKIAFLSDEIERGPFSDRQRDYKRIFSQLEDRNSLINHGFDVDTLSLKQNDIPSDLAALVIADPRTTISPGNLEKINRYIDAGGNLFMTTEPDRIDVTRPLLEKLGLSLREGMLMQSGKKYSSDVAFVYLTDTAANISPQFARFVKEEKRFSGDTLMRVAMPGASAIEYREKDGFKIQPLLVSDAQLSWNRVAPISEDSLQKPVTQLPTDQKGSFVTAVKMSRSINGKDQRIIVASDADFLTNPAIRIEDKKFQQYNSNFGFWCFSIFTYGQFPANTLRNESLDNSFKVTTAAIPIQKTVLYWVLPLMIAISGSVMLIRRRRK